MVNLPAIEPEWLAMPATVVLTSILVAIAWIDTRTLRIPDLLSLPLIAMGLALAAVQPQPSLLPHIIGAIAGYAVLALIGEVHFRRTGKEGLGLGDAKLFAASGAWLGWQSLPVVLLIAAVSGLAYALCRKVKQPSATAELAFGPWLALGFWVVWLWTVGRPAP